MQDLFQFSIISDIQKNSSDVLVLEYNESDTTWFDRFSIPELIQKEITEKLSKKESFSVVFYADAYGSKKVCIFSIKDRKFYTKEVSKIISSLDGNISWFVEKKENIPTAMEILVLSTYKFDLYLSKKKEKKLTIISPEYSEELNEIIEEKKQLLSAIYTARNLVNTPASDKYGALFVEAINKLPFKNTKIKIIEKSELQKLGMNLLLAVSSGSDKDPYVVVFERISDPNLPTYSLVGKGVTFDAGGLQIKPDEAMLTMKDDMAGAAAVLGTMWYLDSKKLNVNLVGAIGLTENLLGGSAFKPLDIITAFNGKTVEIHHTDAEGRLLLADVIAYVEKNYQPKTTVTVATLTGACLMALGFDYAGVIGDDEEMIGKILDYSEKSQEGEEKFWRLPLDSKLIDCMKGDISDIKNLSSSVKAGASTGAWFLTHFLENSKLAHIDIAGPAYRGESFSYFPKGGTGFGILTLSKLFSEL